jgi:uncharacterized protein YraI
MRVLGVVAGATAAVLALSVVAVEFVGEGHAGAAVVIGPATPIVYPSGSSETRANRTGFDTCTAPSLDALEAWKGTSPYTAVNIYFGGRNRGCSQPNLTKDWVTSAQAMGWRLIPTYFGDQPSCIFGTKPYRYTSSTATARGQADGADAAARAKALGLRKGSALYADVEHYDRTIATCRTAVRRYVSAWTTTLHGAGYIAGVYVHQDSGLRDLSATYDSTTYARPDAVWMARWNGDTALTGWPTAPDWQWGFWQRAKQYQGDHSETWGGVTLAVDSDRIKGPVATVAQQFTVTKSTTLYARSGPSTSYPVVRTFDPGATLGVLCQTTGRRIRTSPVWDRLVMGAWVPDVHLSTPSTTGFFTGLPKCTYPGQVTSSGSLVARKGPGTSYAKAGTALPRGGLAPVMCQTRGSKVGTTYVWDRLADGRWVTDYYISNRSNTTWSHPVPRCP